ncbi:MAG: CDP-diacylglycerol--serine O-phosphatidyltransferase [Acidobacteriota bacterium]
MIVRPLPSERPRRLGARLRGAAGIVPGALTIGNMLAGYAAILAATEQRFPLAALLVLAAAALDGLDGRIARLTGTTSRFGEQLDSLADAVSFAVAPSMLAFFMGLERLGRVGWAACFLYAACGVIRLARFNALPPRDSRWFIGLPIPAAAAAVISPALLAGPRPMPDEALPFLAIVMVVIALLMISPIRYRSYKDLAFGRRLYRALAVWAALLAGLLAAHEWVVPALALAYLVSPLVERTLAARAAGGTADDELEVEDPDIRVV